MARKQLCDEVPQINFDHVARVLKTNPFVIATWQPTDTFNCLGKALIQKEGEFIRIKFSFLDQYGSRYINFDIQPNTNGAVASRLRVSCPIC